ncbi:L,D-transpeptidase family protein [Sphingomonas sp. MG17]|uniref:L,D-transpeptidase family protein n=1 Tax=Sphingomonas tagetis TaxID=2949092 RepID=A0A9X2KLD4_9SPHN|nr:L,D-transpeptidase family protein [Sphingomonas tagetis]MCP3730512.1 L,D-transpeptidase family protein [Sphingomonas tagetis]
MSARGTWIRTGIAGGILLAALGGGATLLVARPVVAPAPAPAVKAPVPVKAVAAKPAPAPSPTPEPLVVKRILAIDGPIRFGDYFWDTAGIPAEGALVITVDLEAQTMSVFRDGYEIGATAIIYGADEKPTPLGLHTITQKKVHHISNLYGAPMPYMMRLTNDGVAIHASEKIDGGYATHGCIGVPLAFAKLVFAQAKLGDRVIITRGKRLGMGGTIAAS